MLLQFTLQCHKNVITDPYCAVQCVLVNSLLLFYSCKVCFSSPPQDFLPPIQPSFFPLGALNKLGCLDPWRALPLLTLPHHCYLFSPLAPPSLLPWPLRLHYLCCWGGPRRSSDDPLGYSEPHRTHCPGVGRTTSVSVREPFEGAVCILCGPPAKPGRKLGLPLYSFYPWDALPSKWWRWVRESQLSQDS